MTSKRCVCRLGQDYKVMRRPWMHAELGCERDGQAASRLHRLFTVLSDLLENKAWLKLLEHHSISVGVSSHLRRALQPDMDRSLVRCIDRASRTRSLFATQMPFVTSIVSDLAFSSSAFGIPAKKTSSRSESYCNNVTVLPNILTLTIKVTSHAQCKGLVQAIVSAL